MTEPYILCGDNQIPIDRTSHLLLGHSNSTEKDSSVLKWFQRWRTLTFFVGAFKFQLKEAYIFCWDVQIPTGKNSVVSKWLQRWHNLTSFGGHSNSNWKQNSSVLKWFLRWQTPTSFVGTFKIQLKKTIQYLKGLKDRKILHPLWGHSNSNWKRQFSIEMITKMSDPDILCWRIQISVERSLHILLGRSNSNWKK